MSTNAQHILQHNPARRGQHAVYRPEERNHCPGCGGCHWILDRRLAECGFCAAVLPFADNGTTAPGRFLPWLARARNAQLLTENL